MGCESSPPSPPAFTAVMVHGLIFKCIFFYSMAEKLELIMKLVVTTVLEMLKESARIIK